MQKKKHARGVEV